MKLSIFFSALIMIIGCGTQKKMAQEQVENSNTMIKAKVGEINVASDPLTITNVNVKGNILLIDISYSGGCKDHSFEVVGSPMIAKSLPPIRAIQLIHHANSDQCKKMILQTLEVDLKDLAYQQKVGSKIFLTLDGWKDKIEYSFE